MNRDYLNKTYQFIESNLKLWVSNNNKLRRHITRHDLEYLFEFNGRKGLSIYPCRFSKDYYELVFANDLDNKMAQEFVRKTCLVIRDSLIQLGKPEIDLTITIYYKTPSIARWGIYCISSDFKGISIPQLSEKPSGI